MKIIRYMRNFLLHCAISLMLTACFTQKPAPIVYRNQSKQYSDKTVNKIDDDIGISRKSLTTNENGEIKRAGLTTRTVTKEKEEHAYSEDNNISEPTEKTDDEISDISSALEKINKTSEEDLVRPNPRENKIKPPLTGKIITKFGEKNRDGKVSSGINIAAAKGTPAKATAGGIVEFAGTDDYYGNIVIVRLFDSNTYVAYANLKNLLHAKKDEISKGDVIGHVNEDSRTGQSYLHLAVKKDSKSINPNKYFKLD